MLQMYHGGQHETSEHLTVGATMIRAVCFDLCETLVTEAGVRKPSKDTWAARLGLPGEQFWTAWKVRHDARMTGADADFAETLCRIPVGSNDTWCTTEGGCMPTLSLPDAMLFFQERGDGSPAVYVHGGFASLATLLYDAQEAGWTWEHDLAAQFRFITYDRRGCASSSLAATGYDLDTQAADLAALLDYLGLVSAHIIGSSAGGPIALTFAARRPSCVRSLVLVGTALDLFPRGEPGSDAVREHLRILKSDGPEAAFDARPPEVEVTFAELWDHTEATARGELEAYRARRAAWRDRARTFPREQRVAYYDAELRNMQAYIDTDLIRVARQVQAPTLVLHGTNDQLVPLADAEALASIVPNATLHVVQGGSHSLMIRDAQARRVAIDWMHRIDTTEGA
jgi:pimeloyl-ACP methyl ester carboxylesterase